MTGDRSLRDYALESADEAIIEDPLVFLAQPDSLLVTRDFAQRNGFHVNSRVPLYTLEGLKPVRVMRLAKLSLAGAGAGGLSAMLNVIAPTAPA